MTVKIVLLIIILILLSFSLYIFGDVRIGYKHYCPGQDFDQPSCICSGFVEKVDQYGALKCTGIYYPAPLVLN